MLFLCQSDRLKTSNESRVLNMAKIDCIQLPADLSGSLGGTPEEAAKVFLSAASKGLAGSSVCVMQWTGVIRGETLI